MQDIICYRDRLGRLTIPEAYVGPDGTDWRAVVLAYCALGKLAQREAARRLLALACPSQVM